MFLRQTTKSRKQQKAIAASLVIASLTSMVVATVLAAFCPTEVCAQGNQGGPNGPGIPGQPMMGSPYGMRQPGVMSNPNIPQQAIPEPPGDGPMPLPVKPGDQIAPLPPPTGSAGKGHGTNLYTYHGKDRTEVLVYVNNAMALVIRPDQLEDWQIKEINGILGINMLNGAQQIKVKANQKQIEKIQEEVLNPYPKYTIEHLQRPVLIKDPNGVTRLIYRDEPLKQLPLLSGKSRQNQAGADPEKRNRYNYQGPLPVIRPFARYLVLIGLAASTVWIATAAMSVTMGHPYGGARVAQAFFGIGLLLCAYTIYKIVVLNMMHKNSDRIVTPLHRPYDTPVNDAYMQPSSTPPVPFQTPTRPARPGLPVAPLVDHP